MRALKVNENRLVFDPNYPSVVPGNGEVEIEVLQAGICETDLQIMEGYMGFSGVLGHEFVGIAASGPHAGRRVVGEINCVCEQCELCRRGLENHCPHRTVVGILGRDGAFAQRLTLPQRNLHPVPDDMTDDQATLVEPAAAALQIAAQVSLSPSMRTVVVGDGRLGNLCAQMLQSHGCDVLVVGKHLAKLERIAALGLPVVLREEAPRDRRAELVVDCTGTAAGLEDALALVQPRGILVLKTTVAGQHQLSLASVVIDEITFLGSRCGPFRRAIRAITDGEFDLSGFVRDRFRLDQFEQAFDRARAPDALKVVFDTQATA